MSWDDSGNAFLHGTGPTTTVIDPDGTPNNILQESIGGSVKVDWGFSGPAVNPNSALELPRAVAAIGSADVQPDFVIFTGDLTHTTDDVNERRRQQPRCGPHPAPGYITK